MRFTHLIFQTVPEGGSVTIFLARFPRLDPDGKTVHAYAEVLGTAEGPLRRHWRDEPRVSIDSNAYDVRIETLEGENVPLEAL